MRARAILAFGVAAALTPITAGCQDPSDGHLDGHGRLVDDLVASIDGAHLNESEAEYLVGTSTDTVTVAHSAQPYRDAYLFADGSYVVTEQFTMRCDGDLECQVDDPPEPNTPLDTEPITELSDSTFVPVQTVVGWLTGAATDPNAVLSNSDTTLAGQHSICLAVSNASDIPLSSFEVCITDDGVLAKFVGVLDGAEISVKLVSYRQEADPALFEIPLDADVDDRRDT